MLSPVKAITVGALVFAVGGVLLIAQPFDQQGSVPGANAEVAPPVEFTAMLASGPCEGGTREWVGDAQQFRGETCKVWWEPSEPMLEGAGTLSLNSNGYRDVSGFRVTTLVHGIVNEQGAWRERPRVTDNDEDWSGVLDSFTLVMDGEGDYEGLAVVAEAEWTDLDLVGEDFEWPDGSYATSETWHVRGFIIDGGLPPAGENASTK